MRDTFLHLLQTQAVEAAQRRAFGRARVRPEPSTGATGLGEDERAFIAARDSFYLASVSESGWPYIQHRGGAAGFLQVVGDRALVFADYPGNRQLISVGNVAHESRVALFLMDYVARERLKVLGRARVLEAGELDAHQDQFQLPEGSPRERVLWIDVVGFDWNCPQYITPRFTHEMVLEAVAPLQERIRELEARLAAAH